MKKKCLILAICIVAAISGGLLFIKATLISPPALVFMGYYKFRTNAIQLAELELRNTTERPIWLKYSGEEYPLNPPILERPIEVSPKPANDWGTNIYSFRVGSFFMRGEKVLPGESVRFDLLLHPGEPAKQVGVYY